MQSILQLKVQNTLNCSGISYKKNLTYKKHSITVIILVASSSKAKVLEKVPAKRIDFFHKTVQVHRSNKHWSKIIQNVAYAGEITRILKILKEQKLCRKL